MIRMSEKIIYDKRKKKSKVLIPYRKYEQLLEDLHDLAVLAERKDEAVVAHEDMMRRLKKDGLV
jgi:hypothetical protein